MSKNKTPGTQNQSVTPIHQRNRPILNPRCPPSLRRVSDASPAPMTGFLCPTHSRRKEKNTSSEYFFKKFILHLFFNYLSSHPMADFSPIRPSIIQSALRQIHNLSMIILYIVGEHCASTGPKRIVRAQATQFFASLVPVTASADLNPLPQIQDLAHLTQIGSGHPIVRPVNPRSNHDSIRPISSDAYRRI